MINCIHQPNCSTNPTAPPTERVTTLPSKTKPRTSAVSIFKLSEVRKQLQSPSAVITDYSYRDLLSSWDTFGGPETQCKFHVAKLLTQSQVDRLPKALRARLKCRIKRS
jgi:hypothetical protein